MKEKLNVLYLTNIPAPYRVKFFNELGKKCNLTVLYEMQQAKDRDESWTNYNDEFYKKKQLKGMGIGNDSAFCIEVLKFLDKSVYDVIVVGGYSTPTAMLAILYMKIKRIPFILNADGGRAKKDKWIVKKIKKFFIGSATGYLSTGKYTDEYFEYYGANGNRIFRYPFTSVQKSDISQNVPSKIEKQEIKNRLEINDETIVISVGQFIYRKGFDVLIKSMNDIQNATLYIIGGQPTKEYSELISTLGLTNIKFLPFMKPEELRLYYQVADVFVLPTRYDIWGLVVNEAMAQALPVVTTEQCVAGLEMIDDGKNGFVVPVDDEHRLAEKINHILQDEKLRMSMARNSLNVAKDYSIEEMTEKHIEIFYKYIEVLCNESHTN